MRGLALLLAFAASAAGAAPERLDSAGKVRSLCAALQPTTRMRFKGTPDAVAEEKAKHETARKEAMEREYEVVLGPKEFRVTEVDRQTGEISIDTRRPFRTLGGAFTIYDVEVDELTLEPEKEKSPAISAALAANRATLALTVKPIDDEGNPCLVGTAKVYTLGADFLTVELRDGEAVLARATEEEGFVAAKPPQGTTPTVEVVPVLTEGGGAPPSKDLAARVEKAKPELQRCYEKGLARNPALDGSVVLALEVGKGGRPAAPAVVAESVQDEELVGCVGKSFASLSLPAGNGPYRASVAVHLNRK